MTWYPAVRHSSLVVRNSRLASVRQPRRGTVAPPAAAGGTDGFPRALSLARSWPAPCRRRGVVAVWVVVSLVVMLICVGFAADLPRLLVAVQRTQDVCDAAVLAGAAVLPDGTAAQTQILRIAAQNSPSGTSIPVTIDPAHGDLTFYGPGDTVPGFRVLASGERVMLVRAHSYVPYYFLPIVGRRGADVTRTATAMLTQAGGMACIFSKNEYETNSGWGVLSNGTNATIDGVIHANGKVLFNGLNMTVTKPVEYRGQLLINGSGIVLQGGSVASTIQPYPINYQWTDFPYTYSRSAITVNGSNLTVPGGASRVHVTGNMLINGTNITFPQNVTYLVDGTVTLNGSGISMVKNTIIAQGTITVNGMSTSCNAGCNEPGILLISYATTSDTAITFNGTSQKATGIIFAPNGNVLFNGTGQGVYMGSLVGKAVTLNGSNFTCTGLDVTGGHPTDGGAGQIGLARHGPVVH